MASSAARERALRQRLANHLHEHHGFTAPLGLNLPTHEHLQAIHHDEHVMRTDLDHTHETGSGAVDAASSTEEDA